MSKERLEEIETQLDRFMTPANKMVLLRDDAEWLIKYAKEQAERAQELEKRLKIYQRRSWVEDYEKVAKQNKRYRELVEEIQYQSSIVETSDNVSEAIDKALGVLEGDPHD